MKLKTLARSAAKFAALPLGIARPRRPDDVVILLYHKVGVGDREIDLPAYQFERQMQRLAETEVLLTLDEATKPGAPGGVVVTIDDGYRDFHDVVLPVLVRYGIPLTLYLATSLVANGTRPGTDSLTWGQLREAVGTGLVTVGAHTHSHADLSVASEVEAESEMRRSKELIEDHLGVACRHFSYPWSLCSPPADRMARRMFDSAALAWMTNHRRRMDLHALGRTPVLRGDGSLFFNAKLAGLLDGEALVYRLLRRGPWRRT